MSTLNVPREIQAKHRVMISNDLAVCVRRSREPLNLHSGGQVESFHPAHFELSNRNIATDVSFFPFLFFHILYVVRNALMIDVLNP